MAKKTRLIVGISALVIGIISFYLLYAALTQIDTIEVQSTVVATLVFTMESK